MVGFRAPNKEEFQKMKPFAKPFTAPKLVNPKEKIQDKPRGTNLPIRGQ
jgi:hypothetical protein